MALHIFKKAIWIFTMIPCLCCVLMLSDTISAQHSNTYKEYSHLHLVPNMKNVNTKAYLKIIEDRNTNTSFDRVIQCIKNSYLNTPELSLVDSITNGNKDLWLLLPIETKVSPSFDLAFYAYGSQLDSLWVLDSDFKKRESHKIPLYNFKLDYTGKIKTAELKGIGLKIEPTERYILLHMQNYAYSKWSYPHVSDAMVYDQWYFEHHFGRYIFFLFLSGLELGLIIYLLIQYVLLRKPYLLWYILYVLAQLLPNLDNILWSFSDVLPIPYSWFQFKMVHLSSIAVTYILFIRAMLDKKIQLVENLFYFISGACLLALLGELVLLSNNEDYWSFKMYAALRPVISILCLLALTYLYWQRKERGIKTLFIGTFILILSEVLAWFIFSEFRSYVLNMGILIEFIFFSYVLTKKIKHQEQEVKDIRVQNIKLLEQQNDIRQSIARDMHDEVGSILTKLNLQIQLDKEKKENQNNISSLQNYQFSVQKIGQGLKELINVINEGNSSIRDLVVLTRVTINEYFEHTQIAIHFSENTTNFEASHRLIDFRIKRNIQAITKEILQNILKHSKANDVWMDMSLESDLYLVLSFRDNGIGFDRNNYIKGHGLINIEKRIEALKGIFEMHSEKDQGTSIKVKIKIQNVDGADNY